MKVALSILGLLALVACGQAHDDGAQVANIKRNGATPNMFACELENGLSLDYTTTSLNGKPHFHMTQKFGNKALEVVNVIGDGIKVEGAKVSVVKIIPDLNSTKWTLRIPSDLTIAAGQAGVSFQSTVIEVVSPTSIAGPLPGQVPTTTNLKAACQASRAAF